MSFKITYSIKDRVENFKLFYKKENTRPLFGFFYGSEYPLYRYKSFGSLPEGKKLSPEDFDIDGFLNDCEFLFEQHERCGGDFIWSASAFWGIPWLEAALGLPIYADHSTGSIYSEPPGNFDGAVSIPLFDKNSPWVIKTEEFLYRIACRSSGRWPVATTRMRGIADILYALYGGEEFIYQMIDNSDELKEICKKITDFWIGYGKFQIDRIPVFHGGIGSFYYNMWAPEGTIWHQEDAAALISPALYNEFIKPCDERIVKSFNGCIMHQHSNGFVPINEYLEMGFIALELHIDKGGPSAEELYQKHLKILDKKPLLIWGDISEKDLKWIFENLPYKGLAINTVVNSIEQAEMLWHKYM